MSLVHMAHVCSHLQNASRVRLGLTSIPATKAHVALMLAMQKQGFLSSVILGSKKPPISFALEEKEEIPVDEQHPSVLQEKPWLAYPDYTLQLEDPTQRTLLPQDPNHKIQADLPPLQRMVGVPQNPAHRRLWVGLKYWKSEPVLKKMSLISKPTKRITAKTPELMTILGGRQRNEIKGITSPGECIFVFTDSGVLEIREAVERRRGGLVVCRVS